MDPYVTGYYLDWNADKDVGSVILKFSNGQQANFKVTSLSDMAGWAALAKERVLFVASDGTLHTDPATVGN